MRTVLLLTLSCMLVFLTTCQRSSITDPFENAAWIGEQQSGPLPDSLMYGDIPAPLFRKAFSVRKEIQSAVLSITAAGYYRAYINGEEVGANFLDPAWTDYSKRIYYAEYDLAGQVVQGENCIGTTLGNGFYNPLPLRMWGRRNLRESLPVGQPVFIAKLELFYIDGTKEEIVSDTSWKYAHGPILKNNVYLGEVYDGRADIPGWKQPEFNDAKWLAAELHDGPGGRLQEAFFPPVQVTGKIRPLEVYAPSEGIYIADMGKNFTGVYRIKLKGEPGDTVTFRFGERIYEDGELNPMTTVCGQIKRAGMGGPGSPAIAWQTDSYIFGGARESV